MERLGYPERFIKDSLKNKELTDACTVYWLTKNMKDHA